MTSVVLGEKVCSVDDAFQLGQEPTINVSQLMNLLDAVSAMESVSNSEDTFVSWIDKFFLDVCIFDLSVLER